MASETKFGRLSRMQQLQARLEEAEDTLRALRSGEVDAILVAGPNGEQVYTLKGADEAYRVMVQNMAEGALTVGVDGLILFSNEQFATLVGLPLERVIGSSLHDLIAPEDATAVTALLAGFARAEAEVRLKRAPDSLVPVHISGNKLWFDGVECVCAVITDLTEQKRYQEIVASERLARSILDQAAGALLVVDPAGRIIRASRAAGQLAKRMVLMRQFEEVFCLQIKSDAVAEAVTKDYTFAEILSTIQRIGSVTELEALARLPDGQVLDVIVSASLLTGANGECLGCIVLISDVTSTKKAEQEIRRLNSELELRVRSRTAALEAANRELESFADTVAHDLRAPLRGIDGWSMALIDDFGLNLDPQARKYLEMVRSEAQHMGRLIDDLLQLSRIAQKEMEARPVHLTALAHSIAARLKETHSERCMEFIIAPELWASGDPHLLEVALFNLLDNAVKFTLTRPYARIEFGKTEQDSESAYFVRDNGVGFDMQHAGLLFGTFQRLHNLPEIPGTGIGLATVKRVVQRHGGRIWADARAGGGACFYFSLGGMR